MVDYEKFIVKEFRQATDEQIKIIGSSFFGTYLGYLQSEKPDLIKSFKKKYGIGEDTYNDRLILKYVVNRVQKEDFHSNITDKNGNLKKVLIKKPTFEEAMKRITEIREQEY